MTQFHERAPVCGWWHLKCLPKKLVGIVLSVSVFIYERALFTSQHY